MTVCGKVSTKCQPITVQCHVPSPAPKIENKMEYNSLHFKKFLKTVPLKEKDEERIYEGYVALFFENGYAFGWQVPSYEHQAGINACTRCLENSLRKSYHGFYLGDFFIELGNIRNINIILIRLLFLIIFRI